MDAAFDDIIKKFGEQGSFAPKYKFKWDSLTQRAKGIDDGDMVVWLAPGKAGKTTACLNQCDFMVDEYALNPHFDCMEMGADELTKKWTAMKLVTNIDDLTLAQMQEGRSLARSRQNSFLFTRSRPTNLDDYLQSLIKAKRRYNSGVIVIDNFQILVDLTIGRNNTNNRPAYMSQVSKSIKALAGELKVPIFLISQPKQLQDGQMVGANDSEGSSTLTKDCDIFITLNRNPEAKMKIDQMAALGNFETNQSHSDDVYVQVALSRRSAGGFCTLKIDGAKSLLREYNSDETTVGQKKAMVNGIAFVDDNAKVSI
jgi:replicative DNA helicase